MYSVVSARCFHVYPAVFNYAGGESGNGSIWLCDDGSERNYIPNELGGDGLENK